ncbi:glycosyltransferase family 61 protein [Polynucleobacter sp. MWH-P3-07-1]|uniref:glycosyltransferase family 61 protein n=1 Tax=Polynucleobacter sp. MWH-P3-07-1 TaxID=1743173 RepID=UPI001BFE6DBB|nr:glycosyltransferase family 61 protein [Polynucleobacter sp. MWH-P3-07-1]QWD83820.1 glycosyltransferase family 61 protein [Polynucleobacter sp. MWH-P3-07-1]
MENKLLSLYQHCRKKIVFLGKETYRNKFAKYSLARIVRNTIKLELRRNLNEFSILFPKLTLFYKLTFCRVSKHKKIGINSFVRVKNLSVSTLFNEYKYDPSPFCAEPAIYEGLYSIELDTGYFPKVVAFTVSSGFILGGSDFIFTEQYCVHSDLLDWKREALFAVTNNVVIDYGDSILVPSKGDILEIESGIHLVNGLNGNFAHFLTETLPKLSGFILSGLYKNQPILIDAGLHKNIYEAIELLVGQSIHIIKVKIGQKIVCQNLTIVSPTAHVIYNHLEVDLSKPLVFSDSYYNVNAIKAMSNHLIQCLGDFENKSENRKIIFFDRTVEGRKLINREDLISTLVSRSVVIMDPLQISFREQIFLLNNCEVFITQVGASLVSVLFLKVDAKVLTYAGWAGNGGNCHFFINLRDDLKNPIKFLIFPPLAESHSHVHKDFYMDIGLFNTCFNACAVDELI